MFTLQVFAIDHVAGKYGVFAPVTAFSTGGTGFDSAEAQLKAGASRVVINVSDVVQVAVDFLSTGLLTGDSTIEKLTRCQTIQIEVYCARINCLYFCLAHAV